MSLQQGINSVQRQVAKTLARAQALLAYIAAHPEKDEAFASAVHELTAMVNAIKSVKLRDPRIAMLFTVSSLALGATGGAVGFAKAVTEGLVEAQIGVCPWDPLSVIAFYQTQIVLPVFGTAAIAMQEPLLRVAVDQVMKKLSLNDAMLIGVKP